jgi:DNA-binding CsgD family transcriptional regulator
MMTLWEGLLEQLGLRGAKGRRTFAMDESLLTELVELAEQEKIPAEEMVADLLRRAIAQRKTSRALKDRWQSLSPREQEVTALTCRGYTNRQMAARLGISAETIKTHLGHALEKFDLHGKSALHMTLKEWDFSEWEQEDGSRMTGDR